MPGTVVSASRVFIHFLPLSCEWSSFIDEGTEAQEMKYQSNVTQLAKTDLRGEPRWAGPRFML